MANYDCSACDNLRTEAPNLIVNGLGETECNYLQNNTGLSGRSDDCTDLNLLNDCLIGNMEDEVDAYEVCDWKAFMKNFIPNVWTTLKGIICAICGIWTKLECVYNSLVNLVEILSQTTGGLAFVRYYRDDSGDSGGNYKWNGTDGASHTLDIYMDCDVDDPGSTEADRDYIVMISNCTAFSDFRDLSIVLTFYASDDDTPIGTLRKRRGQHPDIDGAAHFDMHSWTTSGAVLVKKGAHVKVNAYVKAATSGSKFWLHQFTLTWIPVNISDPIDVSEVMEC